MIPHLRSLNYNFYSPVPLFRRLSIPRGPSLSLALWTDVVEREAILLGSFEHLHNLSGLRNLYIDVKSFWCGSGIIDERKIRELFEWQDDGEDYCGSSRGGLSGDP